MEYPLFDLDEFFSFGAMIDPLDDTIVHHINWFTDNDTAEDSNKDGEDKENEMGNRFSEPADVYGESSPAGSRTRADTTSEKADSWVVDFTRGKPKDTLAPSCEWQHERGPHPELEPSERVLTMCKVKPCSHSYLITNARARKNQTLDNDVVNPFGRNGCLKCDICRKRKIKVLLPRKQTKSCSVSLSPRISLVIGVEEIEWIIPV